MPFILLFNIVPHMHRSIQCLVLRKLCDVTRDAYNNKKAQLSLTNPRDACEKFARFTLEQWGGKLYR